MDHSEPFLESPGWPYLQESSQNDWFHSPGFPQCPRSVPAVLSIWLWYDPSRNMWTPPGTLSIKLLPIALNHVKGLPARLSFVLQSWKAYHEDLLFKSELPLLSKRRDIATLCHLFKIAHGLCSSPNPFKPHSRSNLRNLTSGALHPPFCRLTLSQWSFYPYAHTFWNYLPEEIVQCKPLSSFKTAIHPHLV